MYPSFDLESVEWLLAEEPVLPTEPREVGRAKPLALPLILFKLLLEPARLEVLVEDGRSFTDDAGRSFADERLKSDRKTDLGLTRLFGSLKELNPLSCSRDVCDCPKDAIDDNGRGLVLICGSLDM